MKTHFSILRAINTITETSSKYTKAVSKCALKKLEVCIGFNGTLRDNLPDGEIFYSLKEAPIISGEWVMHYKLVRLHSALSCRPPTPQTLVPQIIQNQPSFLQ